MERKLFEPMYPTTEHAYGAQMRNKGAMMQEE
jgi:hypothetical protein